MLRSLLAEVDPRWLDHGGAPLDAALARQARDSVLGRRLLGAWLAAGPAAALFAPDPSRDAGAIAMRWTRPRVAALCRDLGVLAHAPPIRGEVRREPVRRLKAALGTSYLLALDQSVWDGRLPPEPQQEATEAFRAALEAAIAADDPTALLELFDRQGRAELHAWATRRDPALADWCRLLHPPGAAGEARARLPEKPVLRVYTHHETRGTGAHTDAR